MPKAKFTPKPVTDVAKVADLLVELWPRARAGMLYIYGNDAIGWMALDVLEDQLKHFPRRHPLASNAVTKKMLTKAGIGFATSADLTCLVEAWKLARPRLFPAEPEKPFTVAIKWGRDTEPGDKPIHYNFATEAELDAFLWGVQEMDGWAGYTVIDNDGEEPADDEADETAEPEAAHA